MNRPTLEEISETERNKAKLEKERIEKDIQAKIAMGVSPFVAESYGLLASMLGTYSGEIAYIRMLPIRDEPYFSDWLIPLLEITEATIRHIHEGLEHESAKQTEEALRPTWTTGRNPQ